MSRPLSTTLQQGPAAIDRKQGTVQALVDQASRGTLDRRALLPIAAAVAAAISSGKLVPGRTLTAAELADIARNWTTSYCHPVGTCKMGTDALAVVGPSLRVRGIEGLRVCDSSVVPTIVTGNTNAASQMTDANAVRLILVPA